MNPKVGPQVKSNIDTHMKDIAIVYFSGSGHTKIMAEAVQRGASAIEGVRAHLVEIRGSDIEDGRYRNPRLLDQLGRMDALIFGTPTYMGNVAAQFKAFMDATSGVWFAQGWKNKLAAAFTHSGSPSGDKLSTLQYLSLFAAQHGMLWIGNAEFPAQYRGGSNGVNRLNSSVGVMGFTFQAPGTPAEVDSGDLLTAEALGERLARFAVRLLPVRDNEAATLTA